MEFRLILVFICVVLPCLTGDVTQYKPIQISKYEVFPQVVRQKVPQKSYNKYIYESFSKLIDQINFQSSAYFYLKDGELTGQAAYDPTKFGGHSSKCRIYKTDIKMKQYRQSSILERPLGTSVAQQYDISSGRIANVYTIYIGGQVQINEVYLHLQDGLNQGGMGNLNDKRSSSINYDDWTNNIFLIRDLGTFKAQVPADQIPTLMSIDNKTYIISDTFLLQHIIAQNMEQSLQQPIKGYTGTQSIIRATQIKTTKQDEPKRFYVLSSKQLIIYQFVSERQIKQIGRLTNLPQGDTRLLAALEDDGWFYATAPDALYVIDWKDTAAPKVYNAKVNGTCSQIEKFKTTMHLSCVYRKIVYVVELFALGSSIQINRFYGGDDIEGRAIVKRIGMGKMAIMTDNEIKILGFGINKNVILEQDNPQPQYNFGIKYGIGLFPLTAGTNKKTNSFIVIKPDKIAFTMLQHTPPELYCEFPIDSIGATYQFLLQFNTSRCSYVNNQQDLYYGSLESICEVSVPITLYSKQLLLQAKHTNAIMIIIGVVLVGIALFIVACVIKYNRSLEHRFDVMQKKLLKMKQGFDKKKAEAEEKQKRDI